MPPNHSRSTGALRMRVHQLAAASPFARSRPSAARACGDRVDRLERAREHAAAGRDQRAVVVLPARARQVEQALPLGEARGRVGIGIDEDVAVVEGGDQPDVALDSSMPLPNTSPDMSPTPTTVKASVWMSTSDLAEMALDRFPRAARGDAHLLVVVAGGAAGGEGVAEPEAMRLARSRWRCRRRSPCPCRRRRRDTDRRHRGGPRPRGGTTPVEVEVVGEVEQRRHEDAVAAMPSACDARRGCRPAGCFGTKPPLAPTGTMTAFLTCCAFTRPRISVRNSSGRSDQRMPPRATGPKRRCTPSTRGE